MLKEDWRWKVWESLGVLGTFAGIGYLWKQWKGALIAAILGLCLAGIIFSVPGFRSLLIRLRDYVSRVWITMRRYLMVLLPLACIALVVNGIVRNAQHDTTGNPMMQVFITLAGLTLTVILMFTEYGWPWDGHKVERQLTLRESPETLKTKANWKKLKDESGWSNQGDENQKDSCYIYGPYNLDPPLKYGFYSAIFRMRVLAGDNHDVYSKVVKGDDPIVVQMLPLLRIDVTSDCGLNCEAARMLSWFDLATDQWREHTLIFNYSGQRDLEFRVHYVRPVTLHFDCIILKKIKPPRLAGGGD